MAYKVFKRELSDETVELVNDTVYETKEAAEAAKRRAERN